MTHGVHKIQQHLTQDCAHDHWTFESHELLFWKTLWVSCTSLRSPNTSIRLQHWPKPRLTDAHLQVSRALAILLLTNVDAWLVRLQEPYPKMFPPLLVDEGRVYPTVVPSSFDVDAVRGPADCYHYDGR